jgi:hypothetical protein
VFSIYAADLSPARLPKRPADLPRVPKESDARPSPCTGSIVLTDAHFLTAAAMSGELCYHAQTMKLSQPTRAIAAIIMLFSLLFAQLAVSAYCPMPDQSQKVEMVSMAGMPGCTDMSMDRAVQHCVPRTATRATSRQTRPARLPSSHSWPAT